MRRRSGSREPSGSCRPRPEDCRSPRAGGLCHDQDGLTRAASAPYCRRWRPDAAGSRAAGGGAGRHGPVSGRCRVISTCRAASITSRYGMSGNKRETAERPIGVRRSGRSLEDEGYIHCSFANQVQAIADLVYRGRRDIVLLEIDPARLRAEVRVEALDGGEQAFPHIYAPLPVEAVVVATGVPVGADGRLIVETLLSHG